MPNFDSFVQKDVNLGPYNTLKVSVNASFFASIQSQKQLQKVLKQNESLHPVFVLGGGSNVLFVNDFDGLVLHPKFLGKKIVKEDNRHVWLKVGAGENWHQTVRHCVAKGWGGIENLSLIPGWVGAAPIQNIGAYGVELQQVFESLCAIELKTGKIHTFYKSDCNFGYRDSIFKHQCKNKFIITEVTLKLDKKPKLNTSYGAIQTKLDEKRLKHPTISDISNIVIEIRNSKLPDPVRLANAGSFFKNPVVSDDTFKQLKVEFPNIPGYVINKSNTKVPAGWLIEQTGWKGRTEGNVGTYRQQALVIVNLGGASGEDILAVAKKIQQSVAKKFDIELIPEVNIVGEHENKL